MTNSTSHSQPGANFYSVQPDSHVIRVPFGIRIHFRNGAKIQFPAGNRAFHLKVSALHNQQTVFDSDIQERSDIPLTFATAQQYCIPWHIELKMPDGHLLFVHDCDLSGRNVCVRFMTDSLAEHIAWMPAVIRFQKQTNCRLTIQMRHEPLMALLEAANPKYRFITESAYHEEDYHAVYPLLRSDDPNLSACPASSMHLINYSFSYFLMADNVPELLPLPVPPQEALPRKGKYVCLIKTADEPHAVWSRKDAWNAIETCLKQNGFDCVEINPAAPLPANLAMIYGAQFVIAVNSGLAWLCNAAQKELVMIASLHDAHSLPPVQHIAANKCDCPICSHTPHAKETPQNAINEIAPEQVINLIKTLTAFAK